MCKSILLSPEMFFTKIWMLSTSVDEAREDVEEIDEMLLERIFLGKSNRGEAMTSAESRE